MPKAKLKLDKEKFKKLALAANHADVTCYPDPEKVGDKIHAIIGYRTPSELVELGGLLETLTVEEVKSHADKVAAKAAKAKETVK